MMPFTLNADAIVFFVFLFSNLALGLFSSRGIKTIKEYAVGNRDFSTAVIVSTIVATWVGGHCFVDLVEEVYKSGLNFIWAVILGELFCIGLVGFVFASRMGEFLGRMSIAEAMGDMFGRNVRLVTAVSGFMGVAGVIGIQLKIAGIASQNVLGVSIIDGVVISAAVVILYSALGGIRAVAFTDVIQCITFSITIPLIAYFLIHHVGDMYFVSDSIKTHPLYNYSEVFDFTRYESFEYLMLFIFFAIPGFTPVIFQRITISKSTIQVKNSFIIAGVICALLAAMVSWIGTIVLVAAPNIEPNQVFKYIISQAAVVPGFSGLILAGIMAMVLSTVDSYINSTAVLVVHDFMKPIGIEFRNELLSARVVSVLVGVVSIVIALKEGSILDLLTFAYSFYLPVVTVPFIMAVLGFRSSGFAVILGMAAGFGCVLLERLYNVGFNPIPPAMLANLVVLFLSHYLLRQPGGWVGIKDKEPLIRLRQERKKACEKFLNDIKNFSLIEVLTRNCPKGDGMISILGFFVMISVFSGFNYLSAEHHSQYEWLLNVIYPMTLFSSALFIGYPLWLQQWKQTSAFAIVWNVVMFSVLICFSFLMVLISGFSEVQLIAFMVNILLISSLIRWRWALVNILVGIFLMTFCYEKFIMIGPASKSEFNVVYLLLLVSSTLVLFLRPREVKQELTEEKLWHLEDRIGLQNEEIEKLTDLKYEFLRNLQHEAKTPIAGIVNLSEALWLQYDNMSEQDRKKLIRMIASSGERLKTLIFNFIDLSQLLSLKCDFKIKKCDLGKLLEERVDICTKLYIEDSDKDKYKFDVNIANSVVLNCDSYYIGRAIDNLIINAIKYSGGGVIKIVLGISNAEVEFMIEDDGIGVPESELVKIFATMVVSSRTHTAAGGRGVGLALCKKVIELHGGKIWAESTKTGKGVIFKFTLPKTV